VLLDQSKLRPYTPRTLWRRPALEKEIQKCGKQGYSPIIDELEIGLSAVAMPVLDASGRTIAAMNIACNFSSVRRQDLVEQILPELRTAVSRLNGILSINIT